MSLQHTIGTRGYSISTYSGPSSMPWPLSSLPPAMQDAAVSLGLHRWRWFHWAGAVGAISTVAGLALYMHTLDQEILDRQRQRATGGEDREFVKLADGTVKRLFKPTREWRVVPDDHIIPKGLEVRMNFETGLNEARLPPPSS